jgi:transposase
MRLDDEMDEMDIYDEYQTIEEKIAALKKSDNVGRRLSTEKRADVLAYLIGGVSATKISKDTGVAIATVYRLKKQYEEDQYHGAIKDINQKLGQYIAASLKYHLDALNNVAKVANEEDYIRSQSGRELAELHKQLEHWTVSILSASNTLNQISEYHAEAVQLPAKTKK